jgi:phage FluMu gp28-like protein
MHAGPLMQPITIDKNNFLGRDDARKQDITVAIGWQIVPCKLIIDVLALQLLPLVVSIKFKVQL